MRIITLNMSGTELSSAAGTALLRFRRVIVMSKLFESLRISASKARI